MNNVLKTSYKNQISNSKSRSAPRPEYSFEEFETWSKMEGSGFPVLWRAFKRSGFRSDLLPSLDRVDSLGDYTWDNVEWVTWKENRRRQAEDREKGKGSSGLQCQPCYRLEADGSYQTFISIAEAKRKTNINVPYFIRVQRKDKEGGQWFKGCLFSGVSL